MLQRVGLGQVRFNVPGLTADSRGVVTGRQMALRFSALERLVSFLRLWSGEQGLDDFQPGLRLVQVRTSGGTREALVIVPVASLPLIDAAARAARTAGGQCFTGAGKHFVQYRDARAPLGYDAVALEPAGESTDFVLYGQDHTQLYAAIGDLPLDKLLLRLDLQRDEGRERERHDLLFMTVRRGLGGLVLAYLHRFQHRYRQGAEGLNAPLRVSAALCDAPQEGTFQRGAAFWILRLKNVPARLVSILSHTPGMRLMAPVADNVAVELGFRHPVHLASCKHAFPLDRLFLFGPAPAGVTVIVPAPVFSPIADLVRLQPMPHTTPPAIPQAAPQDVRPSPAGSARPASDWRAPEAPLLVGTARPVGRVELVVPLRLEPTPAGLSRAVATLVRWQRVGWVRSLCYALPPSAVRGYRLAFLERGILIVAPEALDLFPFGTLLHAPAPGVLVPLGMELRPAISPHELGTRVGATGGALVVFPGPEEAPFKIAAETMVTLEALALADPSLRALRVENPVEYGGGGAADEQADIEIENQPLGPMPLWGLGR
ncbi:MAG: hypothetical protein ABJA82_11610 [Myxococcales bacterium]